MAHTLIAWNENQATETLTAIAGLADQHVTVSGNDIIVPALNKLGGIYGLGASVSNAQMASPSLRTFLNLDVAGLDIAAEPASPPNWMDLFDRPVDLIATEALNFNITNDATARSTGLAWLMDEITPLAAGKITTIRATASTTLTAYGWTNVALTFSQTLPAGRYQIVGMKAFSAGGIAARCVIPGYAWRPGAIAQDAISDLTPERFRHGRMGSWGEFGHQEPPTVDFLSASADTSETVFLDLIKIE